MNILKSLSCCAMAVVALTACNTGGSDEYITSQSLSACVNVTLDQNTMTQTIVSNIGYTIQYNYTANTATIVIEGLKLPDGQSFGQLTFADVPWTVKGEYGWKVIELNTVRPTSQTGVAPIFRSFKFALLDRAIDNSYFPCLDIHYSIDNFMISSLPTIALFSGDTKVVTGDGKELLAVSTDEPIYAITLNFTSMKAELQIMNAYYSTSMSSTTMVMRDIPFTIDSSGRYTLERTEAFTPYTSSSASSTTLNDSFSVTNLRCVADDANYLNLAFDIQVKADQDLGPAHVTAACEKPGM